MSLQNTLRLPQAVVNGLCWTTLDLSDCHAGVLPNFSFAMWALNAAWLVQHTAHCGALQLSACVECELQASVISTNAQWLRGLDLCFRPSGTADTLRGALPKRGREEMGT